MLLAKQCLYQPGDHFVVLQRGYGTTVASAFTNSAWQHHAGHIPGPQSHLDLPARGRRPSVRYQVCLSRHDEDGVHGQHPAGRYHDASGGSHRSDGRGRLHEPNQPELDRQREQRDWVPDRPVHKLGLQHGRDHGDGWPQRRPTTAPPVCRATPRTTTAYGPSTAPAILPTHPR